MKCRGAKIGLKRAEQRELKTMFAKCRMDLKNEWGEWVDRRKEERRTGEQGRYGDPGEGSSALLSSSVRLQSTGWWCKQHKVNSIVGKCYEITEIFIMQLPKNGTKHCYRRKFCKITRIYIIYLFEPDSFHLCIKILFFSEKKTNKQTPL